ncbi:MAG: WD40/YVTN/BNR-like repeat-containing protein [Candidatus Limnocylindrales bacterium]
MSQRLMVLLGTKKGAFILEGDPQRRADAEAFTLRGPLCEGWPINHLRYDPASGALFAGGGSAWYGAAVWRSDDLGETWTHSSEGLTYGDDGPKMRSVWTLASAHGALYAGVEPAGLFRSDDGGATWAHVEGLTKHPTRETWQPGNGGLICHTILAHPDDPARMWVGISSVGCFATEDGGATWEARNKGVRADYMPDKYPETGQCVHKMAMAAGMPDRLYQQNHCGTYRSDDAGRTWECLDPGLPSTFGFPVVAHPEDADTMFTIPLNGDDRGRYFPDAAMAVWRTRDAGATWAALRGGMPQHDAYMGVLREAMARDDLAPFGLYFGTSTGQLWASPDEGERWVRLSDTLPPIYSVETALVAG